MIKKSRFVLALGLTLALGISAFAFADGASDNEAKVDGSLAKTKLSADEYKPNEMFTGVATETKAVIGQQSNPASETINFSENIKFDLKAGSECSSLPPSGSTPEQAQAACPKDSYIGKGKAEVITPGGSRISDITVSVFKGPAQKGIQLHTASPTLQAAAPTVPGTIEKSKAKTSGKAKAPKYKQALVVPHAPETGALMITKFNASIFKASKSVLTACVNKTTSWLREVVYADGSKETAQITQKCTVKK